MPRLYGSAVMEINRGFVGGQHQQRQVIGIRSAKFPGLYGNAVMEINRGICW